MLQKDTTKLTGFAGRLAYVRWLRARGHRNPESDKELAEATGVGYPWLAKWKSRRDAPDTRSILTTFIRGLGLTHAQGEWLLDGHGEPPEPALWKEWSDRPSYRRVAEQIETFTTDAKPAAKTPRRVGNHRKGMP